MKKTRIAGLVFGVLALAAGAAGTYAWFTASDSNTAINVTAATIAVTSKDLTAATMAGGYLPGETIKAEGVVVENTGSREAVLKIVPSVQAKTTDPEDVALAAALENLAVNFGAQAYPNAKVVGDVLYVFLEPDAVFGDNTNTVSISALISGTLENAGQAGEVTFNYEVTAVQGTKAAVAANFDQNVADAFNSFYK